MNDPQKPDPQSEPLRPPEESNKTFSHVGIDMFGTNNVADQSSTLAPGWERATLEKLAFASLN